jgi:hypothetical protein
MPLPNREILASYLDDALSERQIAEVEQHLRQSDALRKQLRLLMQERDRGEHSVGAIWRRHRLSCPSREQLGSFLLGVLDDDAQDYVEFHIKTIGCAFCQANLTDLQNQQKEGLPQVQQRRRRYFQSSAGLLQPIASKKKSTK